MKWLSVTITDQSFIKEMNPLLSSSLPTFSENIFFYFQCVTW